MASSDPLADYNARRDFKRTPEPSGKPGRHGGNRFIVQKHDARRLHWDFRLEVDGVLKSWAVTRGPSLDPDDKRLAVRTEDHPLSYADFEGSIPQGEYGGGTVMLWDSGTWEPVEGKSAADIDKGHLHFRLHGQRMKGEWLLVRMKPRPGEKRENWLLRKTDDAAARAGDVLVEQGLTSVLTGRSMAEIAADAGGKQSLRGKRGKAFDATMAESARHNADLRPKRPARSGRKLRLPAFQSPQLATLVDAVPTGNSWMHEIKFDGYRMLAAIAGAEVRLYTRTGLDWTDRLAQVAAAFAALDLPAALIDGELVALDSAGNPSFSALQKALDRKEDAPLAYFAFDLLSLDGKDMREEPNIVRKERLAELLVDTAPPIRVAEHVIGAGEKLYRAMCAAGQEGIISKRIDAPYRGERSRAWVKIKCSHRQEFVIIGWSESSTKARPFASLLLAQYEDRHLVYKGKVGTGFDAAMLDQISDRLKPLARKAAPADVPRADARGARWVRPDLIAEVAFAEVTADGRLRHPSFVGLRADKEGTSVTPELAAPIQTGDDITITHPDRPIFETGQTKGQLADYYRAIAPLMGPFAWRRPISLVRCPPGRGKSCFFQKHDSGSFGGHVRHVPISEKDGGTEDYLFVEDVAGLIACVQMGTIEFHGWGSAVADVEAPDRMIFDLDPDEAIPFSAVTQAALDIRGQLADLGLASFAMLSGGKGVHVVVPLAPDHDWDTHKDWSRRFATALATAEPDRFVATMSKAKRSGKIFIDYLRNQRGGTAVLPYSARARPGAPVAAPVAWDELRTFENAHPWSIADAGPLIARASAKALIGWGYATQRLSNN